MAFNDAGFYLWVSLRVLFISLIFLYLVCGIDDLIIDIVYYVRALFRTLFRRRLVRPLTLEQLESVPEKAAAILIPAWDESNVISRMLLNTVRSINYRNYHIFVGSYPNDEATKLEVEKVRELYPNIEVIVTPADGPTNKADCLNWVFQGIRVLEKDRGIRFDFFVMHDAEDVVHPLSLKYYNYLIPRVHFIQLPVFPFEVKWWQFSTGVYMDEFAENHTKDLRVRELMASCIPSAGVGTALSRDVVDYLADKNRNQIFEIGSLTEDYLMGLRLERFAGRKIFLQQEVERVAADPSAVRGRGGRRILEPLATREFFPTTFRAAVRQKSRWILGIALQGWSTGWSRSLGTSYFLYRDRKSLVANLSVILGYVVVLATGGYWTAGKLSGSPMPPLIGRDEIYYSLVMVILALFAWRVLNRIVSSWRIYGFAQGLLAVPRLVHGNILNFCATVMAIRRFAHSKAAGTVPAWGKTAHAFPTEDQLRRYHRRLGDLLLERRLVTTAQLDEAIRRQKETGRRLGAIMVDMGVLWEEDLVSALAHQQDRTAVEIDPYLTPPEFLRLVPRDVAERFRVFPLAIEGRSIVLATDDLEQAQRGGELVRAVGRPVMLRWCAPVDLSFAIRRAYGVAAPAPVTMDRLGQRLLREGRVGEEALKQALRRQKRTNEKLGEILVDMKILSPAELQAELER